MSYGLHFSTYLHKYCFYHYTERKEMKKQYITRSHLHIIHILGSEFSLTNQRLNENLPAWYNRHYYHYQNIFYSFNSYPTILFNESINIYHIWLHIINVLGSKFSLANQRLGDYLPAWYNGKF